jgi:hypothetical protein
VSDVPYKSKWIRKYAYTPKLSETNKILWLQYYYAHIISYDWPPDKVMYKTIYTEKEALVAMLQEHSN